MIRGLIFDMDGLLNDSEIVSYKIYQDLVAPYGHVFALEDYARNYSGKTERGNMEQIIAQFSLPFDVQEGMHREKVIENRYVDAGIPLKKGAADIVAWAKENGLKTAIASSSLTQRARKLTEPWGIWDQFDSTVFAEDITHAKPHPEVFQKAADRLGLAPEECIVLEDSQAGILAAHAAGIPVICVPDMKHPDEEAAQKCLAIAEDLDAARDFIAGMMQKGQTE